MEFHISKRDALIDKIIRHTFPDYNGKKIKLSTNPPSKLNSYWEDGSKDFYMFYSISDNKVFEVNSNHPVFEKFNPRDLEVLPENLFLVERSIVCGKDYGITIYANQKNISPLLPVNTDVTENEKIVLCYTRHLKNSYGGESNIRFREANRNCNISEIDWKASQISLIEKGLLRKNGSVTPSGENIDVSNVKRY